MGNRKALFFDIDGTLLSEGRDRQVPESARRALLKAREKGHLVFVNTGRTWCETKEVRHLIDADGWLCGCGTYLMAEGEVFYDWRIPQKLSLIHISRRRLLAALFTRLFIVL